MLTIYLISILVFLSVLIPFYYEIKKGTFDLFNAKNGFLFYLILQILVSGLISINIDFDEVTSLALKYSGTQVLYYKKAMLALLLAIIFFQFGYFSTNRSIKISTKFPVFFKKYRVYFILTFFFVLGYFSFFILINKSGGLSAFIDNIETFRAGGLIGSGFLIYPATRLISISLCIYLIYVFSKSNKEIKFTKIFTILIISLIPAYFLGFRGFIIIPLICYTIIYNYTYKKIDITKFISGFLVVLILFTTIGIYRALPKDININYNSLVDVAKENPQLVYSFLVRSKGLEVLGSVIKEMENNGKFELGYKSIVELTTIVIPKAIWENKPIPSSVRFTNRFFGDFLNYKRNVFKDDWSGISPTILGESFWNFGWVGITLGMFIYGSFFKIIYLTFIRNKKNNFIVLIYALIYPSLCLSAEAFQGYFNGLFLDFYFLLFTLFLTNSVLKFKNQI